MNRDKFCAMILTHGRAGNVVTLDTLRKCGYTGSVIMVIDNEDSQEGEYFRLYDGKDNVKVVVFDKLAMSKRFDTADLSDDRRAIVYARNACFDIAKENGMDGFVELDDDYTDFEIRQVENGKLKEHRIKHLDNIFSAFIGFVEETNSLSIALGQGGDLIGGKESKRFRDEVGRKAMNSFFCLTNRRFWFRGRVNEDVNTYVDEGSKGGLFFTLYACHLIQKQTQKTKGGMTELYLDSGTYLKSFYSVIFQPSAVKIGMIKDTCARIHHSVDWEKCVPKIMNERWRKK